ncbi:MAG TPA: hypothetical protein VHF05_01320 [Candidatus Paceibacterota bacterium]|jgi:hypothetical protein|nr:hypothetical protein [Candidatus Paceibacterota bacterium]
MKSTKYILAGSVLVSAAASAPLFAFAAFSGFKEYLTDIDYMVHTLIYIAVAAAVLVFIWGLVKFIASAGNERSHESGRQLMIWGSIALFVIASVGGIIFFIQDNLGIYGDPIETPSFMSIAPSAGDTNA